MVFSLPKFSETYRDLYWTYILPFILPVAHVGLMGSTYSTLALAVERYVAVCHPFQARRFVTTETRCSFLMSGDFCASIQCGMLDNQNAITPDQTNKLKSCFSCQSIGRPALGIIQSFHVFTKQVSDFYKVKNSIFDGKLKILQFFLDLCILYGTYIYIRTDLMNWFKVVYRQREKHAPYT